MRFSSRTRRGRRREGRSETIRLRQSGERERGGRRAGAGVREGGADRRRPGPPGADEGLRHTAGSDRQRQECARVDRHAAQRRAAHRSRGEDVDLAEHAGRRSGCIRRSPRRRSKSEHRRFATRVRSAETSTSGRGAGISATRSSSASRRAATRCFSITGENQFHAIFGGGPSFIVHPSSLAVPAVAYRATFRLVGPKGERVVPAAEYFTLPTRNVRVENVLAPDELLTHVILPAPGNLKSGHYEVRYKTSHDWPIAFATVLLTMKGTTVAVGAGRDGRRGADSVALSGGGEGAGGQDDHRGDGSRCGRGGAPGRASAQRERLQNPGRQNRRQARDLARGRHRDGLVGVLTWNLLRRQRLP